MQLSTHLAPDLSPGCYSPGSVVLYHFALSPGNCTEKLAAQYNKLPGTGFKQVMAFQGTCAAWEEVSRAPDLKLYVLQAPCQKLKLHFFFIKHGTFC